MALESRSGLRLGLMALGYRRVIWFHIACPHHGLFRVGLSEEQEYYRCPNQTCQQACSAAILCEGFTRQPLPFPPERIHAQLTIWQRQSLLQDERPAPAPRRVPDMHHTWKLKRGVPEHQPRAIRGPERGW